LILVGVVGGILSESFLMAQGIVYMLLGLLYVAAFISTQPPASNTGYWAGFALGVVGAVMILIAVGFAVPFDSLPLVGPYLGWVNTAFGWVRWLSGQPGSPFLFIYVGLEYLILAFAVCSDSQLMTLTRREFAAYFYSPVAYIVMVAFVFLAGLSFYVFVSYLVRASTGGRFGGGGIPEPVLYYYLFGLLPIFAVVLMVPVITMRLFAEENRSGTMEMLLTAPVKERTVVLSKFLAALRFFLLLWYPWAVYLIALRVEGGEEFDYRALLSFLVALVAMGAGFVSVGMFFSSLTRNQIIAAILTFLAMVTPIILYFIRALAFQSENFWTNLLSYVSYIELWDETARGVISPRYLLFHVSVAIFFIFLTIKVLESRRWR
jgi:ABC-type transport system involved in multi-copper enzyme maturation permease subunit